MSPLETHHAAQLLELSTETFIAEYASHTLSGDDNDNQVWIQLKNDPTGTACVFLNDQKCRIYEARPVQCSTYPFWPNLLESEAAWDEEVRMAGLPFNTDGSQDGSQDGRGGGGPYWTPEGGGCEGMQYIGMTADVQALAPGCIDNDDNNSNQAGVSIAEAHAKLEAYEWEERRFPKNLTRMQSVPVPE